MLSIQKLLRTGTALCAATLGLLSGCCSADASTPWIETLSQDKYAAILWHGDVEEGSLYDWDYLDPDSGRNPENAGGGIYTTPDQSEAGWEDEVVAQATDSVAHSGRHSAQATIRNAFQEQNGNRAVRLMRWTDKPWDWEPVGGEYFPVDAYYGVWMRFPHAYNPNQNGDWDVDGDGGWWNVFQFKSDDADGVSQPVWVLNIGYDEDRESMYFYLYSKYNAPFSYEAEIDHTVPVDEWFHVEARYLQDDGSDGRVAIWMDDELLFDVQDATTKLAEPSSWGIGNYTEHIAGGPTPGTATVYFDDATVATMRIGP